MCLNVGQIKVICGKRRAGSTPRAIGLRQQEAEIVSSFKHLGTVINQPEAVFH